MRYSNEIRLLKDNFGLFCKLISPTSRRGAIFKGRQEVFSPFRAFSTTSGSGQMLFTVPLGGEVDKRKNTQGRIIQAREHEHLKIIMFLGVERSRERRLGPVKM